MTNDFIDGNKVSELKDDLESFCSLIASEQTVQFCKNSYRFRLVGRRVEFTILFAPEGFKPTYPTQEALDSTNGVNLGDYCYVYDRTTKNYFLARINNVLHSKGKYRVEYVNYPEDGQKLVAFTDAVSAYKVSPDDIGVGEETF